MQVDVRELEFIKQNTPAGMYSIIAQRLNEKGIAATRFTVAKEATNIKGSGEYNEVFINELREVFTLLTGLSYEPQTA